MKIKHIVFTMLTFCLFSLPAIAQVDFQTSNFKMSIAGTSTLHDWESAVTKVNAKAVLTFKGNQLEAINSLSVTVPVKSIESTKGRMMDNKTYEALKSDKNPNITFLLKKATISANNNVSASGLLTIAGKTCQVTLTATGKTDAAGNITFTGDKTLLMSDYGMETPTALMGTVKTGNEITVKYQLTLSPSDNL